MREGSGVLVFSDNLDMLKRLSTVAAELAHSKESKLVAATLAGGATDNPDQLASFGYELIVRVTVEPPVAFPPELYTAMMYGLLKDKKFSVSLFDTSKTGMEVCARVSQRLGVGAATGCKRAWFDGSSFFVERLAYGGKFTSVQKLEREPFIVSLMPREQYQDAREAKVEAVEVSVTPKASSVVLEEANSRPLSGSIEDIERVVAVGRGLRRKEDLSLIQSLAASLRAVVAGTRPLTEDLKWLPHEVQVGISGRTIKPKLYVACGLSGQIQHIAGMRESQIVVAINTDKEAPIIQEADYAIVGDMYQVLPALTQALAQRTSTGQSS